MQFKLHYILMLLMLVSSILGMTLRPTQRIVEETGKVNLESLIPRQFNDWQLVEMGSQLVNPQTEAAVNKIYAQTLSRTYVNNSGERVMLSIAYGEDQSDSVGAHLPEGCYGGQGFDITNIKLGRLDTQYGAIPVSRLLASKRDRIEPITYWLTTGEKVAYSGWDTKKIKLQYALQGVIPDGLLMRVSSIVGSSAADEVENSYMQQSRFVQDLLTVIPLKNRLRLIGQGST